METANIRKYKVGNNGIITIVCVCEKPECNNKKRKKTFLVLVY